MTALQSTTKGAKKGGPRLQVKREGGLDIEREVAGIGILTGEKSTTDYVVISKLSEVELIITARVGVPAKGAQEVFRSLGSDASFFIKSFGMSRSTINRRAKAEDKLTTTESERVLGLMGLVGLVKDQVEESDWPDDFDAEQWVGEWLRKPNLALGNEIPASYLDTAAGVNLLRTLLQRSHAGVYS